MLKRHLRRALQDMRSNRMLSLVVGPVFNQVANSLVDSFQKRAAAGKAMKKGGAGRDSDQ